MPARFALAGILSALLAGASVSGASAQTTKPADAKSTDAKTLGPIPGQNPIFIVIDPDRIRRESMAGKSINSEAEKYGKQFEEQNQKDEATFRTEDQEFQKLRGTLTQEQLATKGHALELKYGEVQRVELRRRQAFEKSFNAAQLKWQQAMMEASRDIAAQHNADAVLQSQALLFFNTKWDVTNEIIDLMNKRLTKVDFPPPKVEADNGLPPVSGGASSKQLQPGSVQAPAAGAPSGGLKLPQN
jgi:Skp family chaperone for outer membrane proteins